MSRVVRPAKLDSDLYKSLARDTGDGFGTFVGNIITLGVSGFVVVPLATYSLFFLLLLLIPVSVLTFSIKFFKNTEPTSRYESDKTLYDKAYGHVSSIIEPNSFEDAKTLATNIWKHEASMNAVNKPHDGEWHCKDCYKRLNLIIEIKNTQPLPEVDGSDIERIEHKLRARKELAA